MPARVLAIGLDGGEGSLLGDGRFPTVAGLTARGASGPMPVTVDPLVDSAWPEIGSGVGARRTGIAYPMMQTSSADGVVRTLGAEDLGVSRWFWHRAAAAGARVAAIDHPYASIVDDRAEQIVDYGVHEFLGGRPTARGDVVERVFASMPPHPVGVCEVVTTPEERRRLKTDLRDGIHLKTTMVERVLGAGDWDLVAASFSETHCAGHQLWPPSPGVVGEADGAAPGLAPAEDVYRRIDEGIGRLVAAAGPEATIIVYASHGVSFGTQLPVFTEPVLERLGLARQREGRRRLASVVNLRWAIALRPRLPQGLLHRLGLITERRIGAGGAEAIAVPATSVGAIRLAIAGRDPLGTIESGGARHREILALLVDAFTELEDDSGHRLVRDVVSTADVFGPDHHPDLPDVLVRFHPDAPDVRVAHSDRLGTIRIYPRSGHVADHGPPGWIWAAGPGFEPGTHLDASTVDVAPTVLAALGLERPEGMDGRSLLVSGGGPRRP
jgi:predicted AlkP superfamily phosphohydrolase/phosphomutase